MTKVSLEFQAAELLRHPHLQAYLVKCRNLSPVFLPVKLDKNSNAVKGGRNRPTLLDGEEDIRRTNDKNRQETKTQEGKSLSSTSSLTISCETEMGGERMKTNNNGERMMNSPTSTLHDHLLDQGKKKEEEEGRSSHERAEAMESLLELCAELLREERIEELYGVLKPFAEEAVSSRETAIWLTKGLMSVHNTNNKKQVNIN